MKHLILFSNTTEVAMKQIVPLLFPQDMLHKVFAYMPSDGGLRGERYERFTNSWRMLAGQHNAEFLYVDNSLLDVQEEIEKLRWANILLITGGNSLVLLRNLRRSGLDQAIIEMAKRERTILAGFSAGAMIFTPTVQLAMFDLWRDDNSDAQLTNFDALCFVDYEVFPHYSEEMKPIFEQYVRTTPNVVKTIRDDEYIVEIAAHT